MLGVTPMSGPFPRPALEAMARPVAEARGLPNKAFLEAKLRNDVD